MPPVHCVPKVEHLRYYETQDVLVVPYWPSAVFWPLIIQSPKVFCSWVKDARLLSYPLNNKVETKGVSSVRPVFAALYSR